jgi:hypothetical protein
MTDDKKHGGARPNSGRPKVAEPVKHRTVRLSDADWMKFKALGGAQWLRSVLNATGQ